MLTLRISVNKNNDAVARGGETTLQCTGFSVVFLVQQSDAGLSERDALDFRRSLVMRTVVHDDNFNFAFVICGEKRAQSFRDHLSFVISSHHHTDRLRKICFRSAPKTIREPDDNEGASDHQRRRHNHERPEELLDAVVNAKPGAAYQTGKRSAIALQGRHHCVACRAQQCA